MPPIRVPRPSTRRPRLMSACVMRLSVISPSARNMPSDSIMTTIITRLMVMMATRSKVGMPNWNGVTTANILALATLAKSALPSANAKAVPAMMPIRTAIFDRKPRPYFATSKMTASTKNAMPMLSSAP
ncbi:hypothetical protein D3C81_834730 [compost metagenome]